MIETKSVGLEEAQKIIDAMLKYSSVMKTGRPMAHAVVDNAGILVAFARMDGASKIVRRMAENKAYTAMTWKRDTREIEELIKGREKTDIIYFGEPERQAIIPGGCLLKLADGTVVGAVGSSGRTVDEDEEAALVGVEAFKKTSKGLGK